MAKNKKFKKVYTIVAEGTTTNGAMTDFLDNYLAHVVTALDNHKVQTSVTMTSEEQ